MMFYRTMAFMILFVFMACATAPTEEKNLSLDGFYAEPKVIIEKYSGKDLSSGEHFILAQAYKKEKEYKNALFHFANSCFSTFRSEDLKLYPQPVYRFVSSFRFKSDYYDDAVYEIAELFMLYNEKEYVVKFIGLISNDMPGLRLDALMLKAKAYSDLNENEHALDVLDDLKNDYKDDYSQQFIDIRRASVFEKLEKQTDARTVYENIIKLNSTTWQAHVAARRLYQLILDGHIKFEKTLLAITAESLLSAGEHQKACKVINLVDAGSGPESDMIRIRAMVRMKHISRAEAVVKEYGSSESGLRMKEAMANELWDMGWAYKAVPLYRDLTDSGVEPFAEHGLKRICIYSEERSLKGFPKQLEKYWDNYNNSTAEYFMLLAVRHALRENSTGSTEKLLLQLIEKFPCGVYADMCRFWLYKIYTEKEDHKAKFKYFRELVIIHPDSSYTWKALDHELALMKEEKLSDSFKNASNDEDRLYYHSLLFVKQKDITQRNTRIPGFDRSVAEHISSITKAVHELSLSTSYSDELKEMEKYYRTGSMDQLNREMRLLPDDNKALVDKYIAMAHYSKKYNHYFLGVYSLQELFKLYAVKENPFIMPEELLKELYPRGFKECVMEHSADYGLDPAVTYAIIKAESSFNHEAVSPAGAIGLMQLMPPTAGDVAKQLKMKSYNLKNPCTSIQFGTKYLSWLIRYFNGNLSFAVGGYNAGAGNVKKWKKNISTHDTDYFVEMVPFDETRGYILRTGKFAAVYRLLYGE